MSIETILNFILNNLDKLHSFFKNLKEEISQKGIWFLTEEEYNFLRSIDEVMSKASFIAVEDLKKNKEIKELIEKYMQFESKYKILRINDRGVIVPKDSEIAKEFLNRVERAKTGKAEEVEVLPLSEEAYDDFEKIERKARKEVAEIINRLPLEMKNVINLAYQIRHFYEKGRPEVAEEIKRKIKERGEKMLKLCNCFCEGYIENLIYRNCNLNTEKIEEKINELLEKAIIFIHSYMSVSDVEEVTEEIKKAFRCKEEYIAIHSLGSARVLAGIIIKEISDWLIKEESIPSIYTEKLFKNDYELTKVWYTSSGEKFYKLLPFAEV